MNLKIGGNSVGKIMYGDKQVGKMYFGGKLVYQNALPVGTILFGPDNLSLEMNKSNEIVLKDASNNLSNINSKFEIRWSIIINGIDFVDTLTKEELFSGKLLKQYGIDYVWVQMVENSNTLRFRTYDNSTHIFLREIKLV